jgi:pilus assembly protein CpaE
MSATDSLFSRAKSAPRAADMVAFVQDRKTEQVLKAFVLDQAMPHVHIGIGGIDEAIAYLTKIERSPTLLLIDLHGSSMPLSDLARLAEVCEPSVQLVTIGERNDVGLFRSLLKIGVRDYLVKPLTTELLKRTIDSGEGRINTVTQPRAGKTVAFLGTRGGVGVTTLAVTLARHLADDTHRRIAYIDLNVHGGAASTLLAVQSNNGLADALQNVRRLDPAYVERTMIAKSGRLFVLSAELPYGAARPFEDGGLGRLLQLLNDSFHYVMLDIGNRADPLAEEALNAAARVYLIADRSVHSTRETIRTLRHIEDRENNPNTTVVLNNPNAAPSGRVQSGDFITAVGRSVPYELPFEGKALAIAENVGEAPGKRAAGPFNQIVARIAADLTGQHATAEPTLLQKLRLRK